jgi:hypothetical protein
MKTEWDLGFLHGKSASCSNAPSFCRSPTDLINCVFQHYTKESPDRLVQTKGLAMFVQINEHTVRTNLHLGPKELSPLGWHPAMAPEIGFSLVAMVTAPFSLR